MQKKHLAHMYVPRSFSNVYVYLSKVIDILWRLHNFDLWVELHLHPAHPHVCRLSGFVQLALCVLECVLCQIQHTHKQTFGVCLSGPLPASSLSPPESSKGPSIRGQAAVTASLSPCRPALRPGQGGVVGRP